MSKKVDQIMPRRSNRQLGISPVPAKLSNRRQKVSNKRRHIEPNNAHSESMHPIRQLEETDKQDNEEEGNKQVTDDIREMEETEDERDKQMADDIGEEDKQAEKETVQPHTGDTHAEKETVQPHEETVQTHEETVQTHEETVQPPKPKKRKGRGPTKMRGVAKHHEDKVEVEWNSIGAHVGKGSVLLSSFLGPLVREYVPVLLDDWRHLDPSIEDIMWDEIQGRFNLTEQWQKDVVFRQMGSLWRSSKSRLVAKIKKTNKKEVVELKPSNIESITA